jgi:hypothetical protein
MSDVFCGQLLDAGVFQSFEDFRIVNQRNVVVVLLQRTIG